MVKDTVRRGINRHPELNAVIRRGVDLELAIQCVELSRLAYAPEEEGRKRAEAYGYQSFSCMSRRNGRDYLLLVSDEDRHFVIFRGSDDMRDWLTNLRLWPAASAMGTVHRGYLEVCQGFMPELSQLLASLPAKPVVFAGHSMGGALALLASVLLCSQGVNVDSLYTFGQPKTGGSDFSRYVEEHFNVPYFRFVHGADAFATWGYGRRALLGVPCYFDIRGRLVFGRQLKQIPRVSLRFHRLEHYRFFLRLNRLRLQALSENEDVTLIQD